MRIIIFNIFFVFLLFFAVFFIVFLGKGQPVELLRFALPLGIVVILSLGAINAVFFLNRKLLALLEKEDWPALTAYLEQKIYGDGRYSPRYVKLLIQSCLAAGNFDGVANLNNRLAIAKPALVEDNALILGTAYLLGGNNATAVEFFEERLKKGKPEDWLRWFYGFSLILTGVYEKAGAVLGGLAADVPAADVSAADVSAANVPAASVPMADVSAADMPAASMPMAGARNILVTGLAAFVLMELAEKISSAPAEWRVRAEEGKNKVRRTLKTAGRWMRKAEKLKNEIHGAVIRGYMDKTGAWIWGSN